MPTAPVTPSTTGASTPSATAPTPPSDTDVYYKSKWGRIAILTGDNYPVFEQTCRTALVVAGAWNIVNGNEARPPHQNRALLQDYTERQLRAIQLISNSVKETYHSRINPFINAVDPQGMWDEIAKDNRALDRVYQDSLTNQFARESWNPKTESLRAYVTRLESYRTPSPISS